MSAAGSPLNVRYGFKMSATSVIELGGISVGMLQRPGVTIRNPREYSFLQADQYPVKIDYDIAAKDVFVDFEMSEVLQANIAAAWDAPTPAGSTVLVNKNTKGSDVSLVVATTGPDGCTRTITMAKSVSVGEGAWSIPLGALQTIPASFQGMGDTSNSGLILQVVDS